MANPYAGEVGLVIDGEARIAKLTLGALAELETALGAPDLVALMARFEGGAPKVADILQVLLVALRAGGWSGDMAHLRAARIEGGLPEALRVAAQLLVLAFTGGPA